MAPKPSSPESRWDSIPLPPVVVEAGLSLPSSNPVNWVSRRSFDGRHLNPEEARLTEDNHALFLGKAHRLSMWARLARLLGWETPRGIYNDESVTALLDYLLQRREGGHPTTIIAAPELSGIFNGNVPMVMSAPEEVAWIQSLGKRLGATGSDLSVSTLADLPAHSALLKALDRNGADLGASFPGDPCDPLPESPDSHSVLHHLWHAYRSSEMFRAAILRTLPRSLAELPLEDQKKHIGYPLSELAIRLSEVHRGRFLHAGVDRQVLYDSILVGILRGNAGKFKGIPELSPLFKAFEGKPFESLRLRPDHNFHAVRGVRNRARTRLVLLLGGIAGALGGTYTKGRLDEAEVQAEARAEVDLWLTDELKDLTFYLDGPTIALDRAGNVERFHDVADGVHKELEHRYGLGDEQRAHLTPLLERWLLEHDHRLPDMLSRASTRQDNTDLFVQEHRGYFLSQGLTLDRPYADLIPYEGLIEAALSPSAPNVSLPIRDALSERGLTIPRPIEIGALYTPPSSSFLLFTYKHRGQTILLAARDYDSTCSTQVARDAAAAYQRMKERFAATPFRYRLSAFPRKSAITPLLRKTQEELKYHSRPLPDYVHPEGDFHFELVLYHHYNPELQLAEDIILARRPGETHFTTEHGILAGQLVESTIFPRVSPPQGL